MSEGIEDIVWKVSDDRLSVLVRFETPVEEPIDSSVLDRFLSRSGIVVTSDPEAFRQAQLVGNGEWTPVAFGTPPKHGVDARMEYYVHPSLVNRNTSADPDEKVDYKNLQRILNVEKGQELARKYDPVPGEPGVDVYGKTIDPKEPRNFPIPAGQGVDLLEDGHLAVASEDGAISTKGQRLAVVRIYPVSGNVSYRTGNIDFKGTVDVFGDVQSGFEVRADGDILVKGLVEGAHLEAGGDIVILGGFQGAGKGVLKAGGSIQVRFANEGTLEAGNDVIAELHILNCNVRAGGELKVKGDKGVIAGGDNRSARFIEAAYFGTDIGVKTILQIGLHDDLIKEILSVEKEIEETTGKLAQVEEVLMRLEQMKETQGNLSKEHEEIRIRTVRDQFALMGDLGKLNKHLVQLKEEQAVGRQGAISSRIAVHPGVAVKFPGDALTAKNEMKYVTFYFEKGEVRTRAT